MKKFIRWAGQNKLNLSLILAAMAFIETIVIQSLDGTPLEIALGLCAVSTTCFILTMYYRAAITAIVIAAMLGFGVQTRKAKASGEEVVVLVIVVIATYVVLRINRECQKKFGQQPPRTNAPPDFAASPVFAASYQVRPTIYDVCEETEDTPSTTFTITGTSGGDTLTAPRLVPTFNGASNAAVMATYGVNLLAMESHGRDGVPVEASQSPIHFSADRTVIVSPKFSSRMFTNTIEASEDGTHWTRLASLVAAEGTPFAVEMNSRARAKFYRVKK